MAEERIWLTGLGVVTALGVDLSATWPRLVRGDRGMKPLGLFDTTGQRSAMVASADTGGLVPPGYRPKEWSRTSTFAWKAALEAMVHAGLADGEGRRLDGRRIGLVVGGTTGGMYETEALLADLHAHPDRTDSLVEMISQPLTATGDRLSEVLGPFCRVRSVCSACSSGANALAIGAAWLLAGEVDAVLAGGADGICRLTLSGFNALAATDPEACRPFDERRKGLNLGEGAGFVVLERKTSALARSRGPVAELAGWAIGAEAHHITNPEPSGAAAARVVARCLKRAGLSPREVDYVNAHGTATPLNDAMEAAALRLALGEEVQRIPVSSSKGQVGHTLGAAGALEAVFAALAVKEGVVLPTMGLEQPDAACPLVHVLHEARSEKVRSALSNSFGFGGMDTVLLLSEPELGPPQSTGGRRVAVTGAAALSPLGLHDATSAAPLVLGESEGPLHAAPAGALDHDLGAHLETTRARRLDRPARLGAVVVERALSQAGATGRELDPSDVGLVLGTAFGSLDPSAAFMHRLFEKGPRFASPAEFPNLVPSSPVGHISIYHALRGATLTTADLGTSGESAIAQAVELLAGGDGDVMVAGAVEEASVLIERIRFCLYDRTRAGGEERHGEARRPRSEGASALVLEAEAHMLARGGRPLAWMSALVTWTTKAPARLPAPRDASLARVVLVHDSPEVRDLLAKTAWASSKVRVVTTSTGDHEGLGGTALVAALGLLARGAVTAGAEDALAEQVLVLGTTLGRGYAIVLDAPQRP